MEMPKLQPFAIKTQRFSFYSKLWRLLFRKRQWQLVEDWHYVLPNKRVIIIPKGFVFDGSSYPSLVWIFFSPTGLLLIPVILHDFCFTYDYLWAKQGDRVYKFKTGNGFYKWSALIRNVGIERNELLLIDYFMWLVCISFGWINWFTFQRKMSEELFPVNANKNLNL
ncbi:DUF1353 domain-containing protein [Colwellia sp. 20A7]|uniref:DUF1353 domain-containing protein n=1 Tax=Colwellia sp. 20A7 TaxID=2689569 RepID=UPI001359FABA|nr:DUF1353 domain-containing protein [Colwellia sp. 20A7]